MATPVPYATQSYQLQGLPISAQRLVNLYAEQEPPDAKTQVAVLGVPGLLEAFTAGPGPIRGAHVMNDVLYVVSANSFYSIAPDGTTTLIGGASVSGSNVVSMADNGNQIVIVNGVSGYCFTLNGSFSAASVSIAGGGTNYAQGDTVTLGGGTYSSPAVLSVTGVTAGAITSAIVQTGGQYSVKPGDPVAQIATSGLGSGATFDVTWTGIAAGFGEITDPNFYPANTVTFYDDYFVLDKAGTNQWFFSNILDGTTYSPLDFNTAEVQSDFVRAIINQQENLLIFGEKSIETWFDAGTNDNPFQRYDGATIERGCAAPMTPLKEDNSVFFLADDIIFYRLDGVLLHRISTHAIEQAWQSYSSVVDAFAFSYTFAGHKFINVTFPSANATWVFDIASNRWHERISYTMDAVSLGRWRGNCAVSFINQTLIGDAYGGGIGRLSATTYTEYGAQILGIMTSPPIHKDRMRVFIPIYELNIQAGVGLPDGQGSNPQIMLEYSKDGGLTYANRQLWQSMGKIGETTKRLRWKKLGQSRQWVLRHTISDPVPRRIIGAFANLSFGL